MPGNSWRDKIGLKAKSPAQSTQASQAAPVEDAGDTLADANGFVNANGLANNEKRADTKKSADSQSPADKKRPPINLQSVSPKLAQLISQRESLETNMRQLVSGNEPSDPRFHIPTFNEKRAELKKWEEKRIKSDDFRQLFERKNVRRLVPDKLSTQPINRITHLTESASQAFEKKDQLRKDLRDKANSALAPLEKVRKPVANLQKDVNDSKKKLDEFDRTLKEQGLDEDAREIKKLIGNKVETADKYLTKANNVIGAPKKVVDKLDSSWAGKNNYIRGAMDKYGGYADKAKRRLSLDRGGSGDLNERNERNRERAIADRKEWMREQQREQAKKDRAKERRKSKDK